MHIEPINYMLWRKMLAMTVAL